MIIALTQPRLAFSAYPTRWSSPSSFKYRVKGVCSSRSIKSTGRLKISSTCPIVRKKTLGGKPDTARSISDESVSVPFVAEPKMKTSRHLLFSIPGQLLQLIVLFVDPSCTYQISLIEDTNG